MTDHTVADSSCAPMTHPAPDRKRPTLGQISQDYTKGLAIIDGLRRQLDELLAALKHVGREGHRFGSVAANGCTDCQAARAAILKAEPRPARDEAGKEP